MAPLNVLLVGCGVVAAKHLKAIRYHQKRQRLSLAGLVDARPEAAERLLRFQKWPHWTSVPVYTNLRDALTKSQPDLVAITTPSGSHAALALEALQAGAHLLIEKPMTLNLAEADQICRLAREQGRHIAVGHIYRYFPFVQQLRAELADGRFGRILHGDVKVRWGHDQAYYDQAAWRGTWTADGGALMNQSIHALDLMIWLLGEPAIAATGRIARQRHQMEAEDLGFGILELANQVWCTLEGTTNTHPDRHEASFFLNATQGEIRAQLYRGKIKLRILDAQGRSHVRRYLFRMLRETLRQAGPAGLLQLGNPHTAIYTDLLQAIHTGTTPLADAASGRTALELVLGLYQAAHEQRTVWFPIEDFELSDMAEHFHSE